MDNVAVPAASGIFDGLLFTLLCWCCVVGGGETIQTKTVINSLWLLFYNKQIYHRKNKTTLWNWQRNNFNVGNRNPSLLTVQLHCQRPRLCSIDASHTLFSRILKVKIVRRLWDNHSSIQDPWCLKWNLRVLPLSETARPKSKLEGVKTCEPKRKSYYARIHDLVK